MAAKENQVLVLSQGDTSALPSKDRSIAEASASWPYSRWEWLWLWVSVCGSLTVRLLLLNFESGDYRAFLSNWYDFLVEHGRWHGLGKEFASYPPLYLYLLSLSTLLPIPKLYAIKAITLATDYLAAWFVWRLVRRQSASPRPATLAVTVFLFLPTVILNGAVWGQCDVMYTAGFLASLFYLLEQRPIAAMVAFGFSCSLKPQAIFWCPLLAGLLASGRLPWRWIWIPAAVYAACGVPQMLAGRPVLSVLGHWAQVRDYPGLTHGAVANWYQWAGGSYPGILWWVGVILTLCATGWLVWRMRLGTTERTDGSRWLVSLALLSVLFLPFLLPGMHERYFFAADILSIIYAFYIPGGWRVAVLMQFASAFAYFPYLFHQAWIPTPVLPLAVLGALLLSARDLIRPQPAIQGEDL